MLVLCDLFIVTFSIWIFYICENSLYQNFGLNNLYYIIISIIFLLKEKENSHTSIALNVTFLYVKQIFNESSFWMKIVLQCKQFFQWK
jgi:hypothetical protein